MSVAHTVAVGAIALALGVVLGMALSGGVDPPTDPGRPPEAAADDESPGDPREPSNAAPSERQQRQRVGPSVEVSTLLERAAAAINPPEIPDGDGRIEGTVKTRAGKPVAGVEIQVVVQGSGRVGSRAWNERSLAERFEQIVQADRISEATRRTTVSGPDGRYALAGLPAAPHMVSGSSDDYRVGHSGQHRPYVTPDAVVDLVADPVVTVTLDVAFEDGTEPDQVLVNFTSGGSRMATSWTPSNRTAQFGPGTYKVSAAGGANDELTAEITSVTLVHGEPVAPVTLVLASRPGIAGRLIMPEGAPFVWAAIGAELIGPDTTPESVAAGQQKTNANQHAGYRYTITGLAPGRYLLVAWNFHQGEVLASREVTVGDEMALADLEVAGPNREDYLEIVATAPDGERLSGLRVRLRFAGERRNSSTGTNLIERPDGVVWAKHLTAGNTGGEPGSYYVGVSHASFGTTEVEYRPGPAARAEVAFQTPSFVDVTVIGASVDLLSTGLTVNCTDDGNASVIHGTGNADAEGNARVGPLQPGVAKLTALTRANRRNFILATHEITVRGGDNEARLVLPSLHTIRIECTTPAARAGQSVKLRRRDGDSRTRFSISQRVPATGKLLIRFIPQGKYQVQIGSEKQDITLPGNDLVRF